MNGSVRILPRRRREGRRAAGGPGLVGAGGSSAGREPGQASGAQHDLDDDLVRAVRARDGRRHDTLDEAVLGLVCGTAIGVLSGVVFSRFRLLERMFLPYWFRLPNFVLPTPQEIVSAALEDPQLMRDTVATVTEAIGGYMAGSALGLAIAIAFVMLPIAGRLLMPLSMPLLTPAPIIADGPLAIILLVLAPRRRWC